VMNNRADVLVEVLRLYLKLKDDREGIAKVQLSVQFIPDADQTERIRENIEKLINKKVILDIKVDKTLLGGFVARFEDKIIDGSLRHQLERLKKLFLKTSINLN
jgi:F-type H+-transporting ATPase subunit delta